MTNSNALPVTVWLTPEESEIGILSFNREDLVVKLESGRIIRGKDSARVLFELQNMIVFDGDGKSSTISIEEKYKIRLAPDLIIERPYVSHGGQFIEDIFPPSTSGFYGRFQAGKGTALYFINRIQDSNRFLLSVTNSSAKRIYETQFIQRYEAEALSLVDDIKILECIYAKSVIAKEKPRHEILGVLDEPAPSWKELSKIIGEVSIPNLRLGNSMRDTISQLVPASFPNEVREELMAFLAYVVKSKIPMEDPLIYSFKFSSIPIMENLLNGHLMYLIDRINWPPYAKLMILAARGQLESPKRAISDAIMNTPWLLFNQKCMELRPSWLDIAVDSVISLNKSGHVVLGLPTTKSAARRSRSSWKKRFAELSYGLRIRGQIDSSILGLIELVYLGAAYRWPHRHMKFISRLGAISDNSPHLQVMIMPPSAAERVKRAIPNMLSVGWSKRTSNFDLFDNQSKKWMVPIGRITDSLDERSSIKKLINEFRKEDIPDSYLISKEETRVADFIAEGIESFYFEIPEFLSNFKINKNSASAIITNLVNRKILQLSYDLSDPNLISLATIIQGNSDVVTSLVSAFLKHTPSSHARLNEKSDNAVILSRFPEESIYLIVSQLTQLGPEREVNIRCMRPITFQRYTSNLYQRLLREDGTWDDDVSAFLSQARSKRRELSESKM
ncbi:MAG: hypothetical protein OEV85_01185 [Candidatus Thorarchaeota archaeon]|nr:hypothetical protein [Candidatus Thorarchaeota archaeon]